MNKPPLDFSKVEAVRKRMLLSQADMAKLLSVSRMTYYSWVCGKPLRKVNEDKVKRMLKKLLYAVAQGWPMPEVHTMSVACRMQKLQEILDQANK